MHPIALTFQAKLFAAAWMFCTSVAAEVGSANDPVLPLRTAHCPVPKLGTTAPKCTLVLQPMEILGPALEDDTADPRKIDIEALLPHAFVQV